MGKDPMDAVYGNSQVWSGNAGTNLVALNKNKKAKDESFKYAYKKCDINERWIFHYDYYLICKEERFGELLNLIQENRKRFKRLIKSWQEYILDAKYRRKKAYKKRPWTDSEATILEMMYTKYKDVRRTLEYWLYYDWRKDSRNWKDEADKWNNEEMKRKDYMLEQLRYLEDQFLKNFRPILKNYNDERK